MHGRYQDKGSDWKDSGHSLADQETLAFLDHEALEAGFGSERQKQLARAAELIRARRGAEV